MARVVIIGSAGRLGAALVESYSAKHEVIAMDRHTLDLGYTVRLRNTLASTDFDVVINCAALTNVDYCETHREQSFAINSDAVGFIAEECAKKSARLIHISTDYVLSGEQTTPYEETISPQPISVYGESKRGGEKAALAVSEDNLVVRVSWVFGPHRPSFVDGMLRRAATEPTISAVFDKFSAPSYTLDLAEMLEPYLSEISAGGILHLCNSGWCSWQEYAQHALDVAHECGLPLQARTVDPIPLESLTAFVAKRPRHTLLSTARYTRETGKVPRPWQDAVAEYVRNFGPQILA
ncbi:MAG TPA: dTDP-4-dehydrorhamnose reductase [Chthoniobacterales bacterium]|jgi:dTDP-4-dehydrorhamnose reductase